MEKLARAADRLRDRFGFSKVQFGGSLLRGKDQSDRREIAKTGLRNNPKQTIGKPTREPSNEAAPFAIRQPQFLQLSQNGQSSFAHEVGARSVQSVTKPIAMFFIFD
jgi:hypothetical protein